MNIPYPSRGLLTTERSRLSRSRIDPDRLVATMEALEIRPAKLPETIVVIDAEERQGFTFREVEADRHGDLVFAEYAALGGPARLRVYA